VKTIFTGFVNQSEVSRYYIVSDCAVNISSYDPSPKALNEAMNFSLPVIVTEVIGTAYDLVDDGGNGFIIKNSDVDTLSKRLKFLNSNRLIAKEMGERSFSRISRYTMDTNAQSLWSAASLAVGRK
jgi:glycosyltransferase involved in cell wall biosynthesis